jgi:hypothetical protein
VNKPQILLLGSLVCAIFEVASWRPVPVTVPDAPPSALVLVAVPQDSTLQLRVGHQNTIDGTGTLIHNRIPDAPDLQVYRSGYHPLHLGPGQVQSANRQILRLQPLWWRSLLDHWGALAAVALAGLAWTQRSRAVEDQRRRVGQYRLNELAGRGAMAEVYRASAPDGTTVALKLMLEDQTPEFAARFEREAQICSKLRHPGLVKVYDYGQHEGRWWMSQEWIPGSTLDSLPRPLPPAQVRTLLLRICEALEAAHAAGVVHRDLKPANILLRRDGSPVIADFGLARSAHYQTITKTDATLGTPAYMPPEQITNERSGSQADLYSLGCIAYQLLTGRLPFQLDDPVQTLLAHMTQTPPPAGVSPAWDALLADLLHKDPQQRPAGAAAVLARLEAIGPEQ